MTDENEEALEKWKAKDKAITRNARLLHNLVKAQVEIHHKLWFSSRDKGTTVPRSFELYDDMVLALEKIELEGEI